MGIPCFLVERTNEHLVHKRRPPEDRCDDSACGSCSGWDEMHFDIRRVDTGEIIAVDREFMGSGLPPGAMYWQQMSSPEHPTGPDDFEDWTEEHKEIIRDSFATYPTHFPSPSEVDPTLPRRRPSHLFADGLQLVVILPNGHSWNIDSRASNCTMPWDYSHRCWVRSGEPPVVNVDKNGHTCAAGAGSIATGDWHGFLRHGELVS